MSFVADPHWGWWIVFYFFLGGIAAGAYFTATIIDLTGRAADRELARIGYFIALPLVMICGVLLILDLNRPERFWHMLVKSEVVHEALAAGWPWTRRSWQWMARAPLLKYWSPMSIGSWALLVFGACSFLSVVGSLWPDGRLSRLLRHGIFGRTLQVAGAAVGFFVAAYTGALLTATNQPLWSDSVWIAPLFLTSAASTGIATMILIAHYQGVATVDAMHRLERADLWALTLELILFLGFLASLGAWLPSVLVPWQGKLLVFGTLIVGLLAPLAIHLRPGVFGRRGALAAAAFALAGGFLLRYALLMTPPQLTGEPGVSTPPLSTTFSPEDGRAPGGGPGADPDNRPAELRPRSKVFNDD